LRARKARSVRTAGIRSRAAEKVMKVYEYLIADLIAIVIWLVLYGSIPRLRKLMVWGSATYLIVPTIIFILWKGASFFIDLGEQFIPYYWNPPTLFNLGPLYEYVRHAHIVQL
jgi:hypothetical protein